MDGPPDWDEDALIAEQDDYEEEYPPADDYFEEPDMDPPAPADAGLQSQPALAKPLKVNGPVSQTQFHSMEVDGEAVPNVHVPPPVERGPEVVAAPTTAQVDDHDGDPVVPGPISEIVLGSQNADRLYSFKRYSHSADWRTTKTLNGHVKKEVQSSSTSIDNDEYYNSSSSAGVKPGVQEFRQALERSHGENGKMSSRTNAADAQLVSFLACSKQQPCCCSNTNDLLWSNSLRGLHSQHSTSTFKSLLVADDDNSESVPLTLLDGNRIYVRKRQESAHPNNLIDKLVGDTCKTNHQMLELPMEQLIRRQEANERMVNEFGNNTEVASVSEEAEPDHGMVGEVVGNDDRFDEYDDSDGSVDMKDASADMANEVVKRGRLWVDTHTPTEFSHLLSDERTNREVLRALRSWDPYVFKRAAPPRPSSQVAFLKKIEEEKKKNGISNTDRRFGKKQQINGSNDASSEASTNDTRPDPSNRVILLCGPPGVGKTTLALIAARHAGYRPVEVNASDERSASVLKERVLNAMESTTLNLKSIGIAKTSGRPNCVILDEVDGADARSTITTLVDIIRAEIPPKKTGKKKAFLRRPIIFICNHKYAPALRPLLSYAKVFDLDPPKQPRLVARLKNILHHERYTCSGPLLLQLADGSAGDIRSCLHTLQFSAAKTYDVKKIEEGGLLDVTKTLTSTLGGGQDDGLKDRRSDSASILFTVFRRRKPNPFKKEEKISRDVERVLRTIEAFNDPSKTLDSLFTNILGPSYVDPTLDRCFTAHEWLSSADIYSSHSTAAASHDFGQVASIRSKYTPLVAAAIHLLCRVETKPALVFTLKDLSNCRYQSEANSSLVSKFLEGLSPKVRCNACWKSAVNDLIPYFLWLLSPGKGEFSLNRPVSSIELLNKNEKVAFNRHVATLRSFGLTYVKNEDIGAMNSYSNNSRLEPAIDRIVKFNHLELSDDSKRQEVSSVLKNLLAHGVHLEAMRAREIESLSQKIRASPGKKALFNVKQHNVDKTRDIPNEIEKLASPKAKNSMTIKRLSIPKTDLLSPVSAKRIKMSKAASFLGMGAAKAKASRAARRAGLVATPSRSELKNTATYSGSGAALNQVIIFRYQKGFTQAVRVPCQMDDFI